MANSDHSTSTLLVMSITKVGYPPQVIIDSTELLRIRVREISTLSMLNEYLWIFLGTVHESLNIPTSGSKGGSGTYPPAGERIGNHRISADDFKLDAKEVFAKRGVPSQVIDNFPWASMSQQKGLRGVLRIDPQGEYQLAFLLSELLNWLKKNSETIDHESKYIQVDKHKNVGDLMQPYMDHLAPLVRKKYSDV
ncbi:hypothetical protein PSHT_15992 [Puccinia striiformis]|uniref:Uncharacterized protein n=1 Tax=Puccinia striiformis TaxID=27350 RepID=A0A2S4UC46_9BASI|nr:hypothetical protein PSHT_15992 [Puccinia striiformis]